LPPRDEASDGRSDHVDGDAGASVGFAAGTPPVGTISMPLKRAQFTVSLRAVVICPSGPATAVATTAVAV
jgi:hypothetical protein